MATCGKITATLTAVDCVNQPIAGVNTRAIIINYEDIDRTALTITDGVVVAIQLKSSTTGFAFESADNSTTGEHSLAKGKYFSNYLHKVTLRVFTKSKEAKKFINDAKDARVAIILENKTQGDAGESKYEIYGLDAGLVLMENNGTTEFQDNIVYNLVFGTDETSKETSIPKTIYKTDATATDSLINSLLPA